MAKNYTSREDTSVIHDVHYSVGSGTTRKTIVLHLKNK